MSSGRRLILVENRLWHTCGPTNELIQLAANELADPLRAEIAEHLKSCPECREAFESQKTLWNVLGEWSPSTTSSDLVCSIERKLGSELAPIFHLRAWRITRVAAAIVIGVGAGYFAGRARIMELTAPAPEIAADIEQQAVDALGVEWWSQPSPAGLYAGLLDLEADNDIGEGES